MHKRRGTVKFSYSAPYVGFDKLLSDTSCYKLLLLEPNKKTLIVLFMKGINRASV